MKKKLRRQEPGIDSLIAQCFGGIQSGSAVRGEDSEDQANEAGHSEGDRGNRNADVSEELNTERNRDSHQNSDGASGEADEHRLDEELQEDLNFGCADGQPHSNFAGPLSH